MEALKQKRATLRSAFTRRANSLDALLTAAQAKAADIEFEKIHDDVNIDDRDKFQYLIQSTAPRSSPREIVESFPATAANYKKTKEYLKERYGNTSVLIQVYIRELLRLVLAKNKSDLSSLYDKLQIRIRALDSLGLTKNK
ncbi:DUF1758 domain-containing protein [Trichonephila clavipes]|nr:DUF1758 domain-containing protein [Trichonephila clavipes]